MKKLLQCCLFSMLTMALVGCGFHLRSASELPPELHALYFDADNPYDPVAVGVKETLAALDIKLVGSPHQALYTLHLTKSVATNTQPSISDLTLATTVSFTQTISASLVNNKTKKTTIASGFAETLIQTLNQNQITTNSTTALGTQDLPRRLVNDIYLWLTTQQVNHALHPKTTPKK